MSNTLEVANKVLIPGCYDMLSPDHRLFISTCIAAAAAEAAIEGVVVGLASDESAHRKGAHRPFFSYDWRQHDIGKWYAAAYPGGQVEFEEFNLAKMRQAPPKEPKYRLAVLSAEYERTGGGVTALLAERVIFIPPVGRTHTTDIESALLTARDASQCDRRVGATLLRDGALTGQYHNGGVGADSCKLCSKRIDVQRVEDETGATHPSPVPCDYAHAESRATKEAQPGDYLLTTTSPCWGCAEEIAVSGIERVVYLKPYHNQDPVAFLADSGVQIRQAGYRAAIA